MALKIITLTAFSALLWAACSSPTPPPVPAPPVPITGGDADEHGCKASAGYQWSAVKKECIRVFESGIRLNPVAAGLDRTTSAFVVFPTGPEDAEAEIFLPGSSKTVILKGKNGAWAGDTLSLAYMKGQYSLTGKNKRVLYEGK